MVAYKCYLLLLREKKASAKTDLDIKKKNITIKMFHKIKIKHIKPVYYDMSTKYI